MDGTELALAGIAEQARLLRSRAVSSGELVDTYLERIERIGPKVNPFTEVLAERATADAADADRRLAAGEEGPLLGVPVALKDEIDVEGLIATHGTACFESPASGNAAHWRRLREAGAVLLAKTTLPELAIFGFTETEAFGETRNPWDPERTPGGSSGGSAAAVAAGLVGAASASDGAGSIRIPAANCGLFGLKPQRGRISLAPEASHWLGLSVAGCVARRVRDVGLWLDVAAGAEPGDEHTAPPAGSFTAAAQRPPGRLRIAWSTKPPLVGLPSRLDDEVATALERFAETCRSLGHHTEQRDPDWGLIGGDLVNVFLKGIEAHYDTVPNRERLSSQTRDFKRMARLVPGPMLSFSLRRAAAHRRRINRIFDDFDMLLTPTTAAPAVEIGRWAKLDGLRTLLGMSRVYPYTLTWNYLGQPAAAIPAGLSDAGLPLSVQAVVPEGREDLLLSLGAQLESELAWPELVPELARA